MGSKEFNPGEIVTYMHPEGFKLFGQVLGVPEHSLTGVTLLVDQNGVGSSDYEPSLVIKTVSIRYVNKVRIGDEGKKPEVIFTGQQPLAVTR